MKIEPIFRNLLWIYYADYFKSAIVLHALIEGFEQESCVLERL